MLVGATLLLTGLSPELRGAKTRLRRADGRYDLGADLGGAPVFVHAHWAGDDLVAVARPRGT